MRRYFPNLRQQTRARLITTLILAGTGAWLLAIAYVAVMF